MEAMTILLILALVVAVVAAIAFAGAQRRLPDPFGLARDGAVLVSADSKYCLKARRLGNLVPLALWKGSEAVTRSSERD